MTYCWRPYLPRICPTTFNRLLHCCRPLARSLTSNNMPWLTRTLDLVRNMTGLSVSSPTKIMLLNLRHGHSYSIIEPEYRYAWGSWIWWWPPSRCCMLRFTLGHYNTASWLCETNRLLLCIDPCSCQQRPDLVALWISNLALELCESFLSLTWLWMVLMMDASLLSLGGVIRSATVLCI